jgi:curli biogenesis system outer membrane secretion channel CsgG
LTARIVNTTIKRVKTDLNGTTRGKEERTTMKTTRLLGRLAATALVAAGVSSCAPVQPPATVTSGGGSSIAEAQAIPYNGPKARIAVSKFVDKTAKGYSDIGEGMAEMLTTALVNSNRYIVLERGELGQVLQEQDLAASGRIKKGTEAPTGEIEGAELLIVGAITEFEPNAGGAGGGIMIPGFGVGLGVKTAQLAIDIRIIDARTSRILAAHTVEGQAQDVGGMGGIAFAHTPMAVGFSSYAKTPMEKAIRLCLQTAVNYIAQQTPAQYYQY